MRILFVLLFMTATPALSHELWLEPLDYQPKIDSRIEAHIVNGERFEGFRIAYLPRKFSLFVMANQTGAKAVEGRIGNMPALRQDPLGDGLHVVAYQSVPDTLNYSDFEKFRRFATHKDFADIRNRHLARGLADSNFREVFTRYSKSLIGAGSGIGKDRRMGLETEFVAIDNPYVDDLADGMRVQLIYAGDVRVDAQVELFEKRDGEETSITLHRTDIHGIATLPVRPGYDYMVDAVVLREPDADTAAETGAVWETLWANLTFSVPIR